MGDGFFPVLDDPTVTSPLVRAVPEFGGRWNHDFPGSGDQHINDDSDKQKSTKGEAADDDFNEDLRKVRIQNMLESVRGPEFVVRKRLTEGEPPDKETAEKLFGNDGKTDGKSVYVVVRGWENALRWQQKTPGSTVEPKQD
jgi:hypothetical protein